MKRLEQREFSRQMMEGRLEMKTRMVEERRRQHPPRSDHASKGNSVLLELPRSEKRGVLEGDEGVWKVV